MRGVIFNLALAALWMAYVGLIGWVALNAL